MDYAQLKDSTMTSKSIRDMLDTQIDPTLSLSHYDECPRLYATFSSFLGQAPVNRYAENHLLWQDVLSGSEPAMRDQPRPAPRHARVHRLRRSRGLAANE